jgi:hypothetical protein
MSSHSTVCSRAFAMDHIVPRSAKENGLTIKPAAHLASKKGAADETPR